MDQALGLSFGSKRPRPSVPSPDELAAALGRVSLGALQDCSMRMCWACKNFNPSVPVTRFEEVRKGLDLAIWDMDNASSQLQKFSDNVIPEVTVDEIVFRIHDVVQVLDRGVVRSWEFYAGSLPALSDVWDEEEQWIDNNSVVVEDCEDDESDWDIDDIDSKELNDHRMK